ncbi:hypothetical protein KIH87_02190 [Paraneptunicella aestuarii]|uniref:hypothetical protein n=1 Tax=Paraneptunicella aestuarii TaxID=2831148 RepID=UPI001E589CBA|nr:hypothetical protein [Paraneptunicella aestuarii]UAA39195.1 hypothetical protein KIH87_02190 [Paraneptunicella aestuarii]
MKNLVVFISGLVICSVLALLVLALTGEVKDLETETYKAFLQLIVIGVAGHVVSILITKANNERQEFLERNEFRNSILTRLNNAFIEVKKIRRVLRAVALKRDTGDKILYFVKVDDYHSQMQLLNEYQLELEVLAKDISTNSALFTNCDEISTNLNSMEEYLNSIVDEYEHKQLTIESDPQGTINTQNLNKLQDLIGNYRGSIFRTEFVHTYYSSLEKVREDLVHIAT